MATDAQHKLIEARAGILDVPDPERIEYQHAILCQVGLPRSKQDGLSFERTSGHASMLVEAGKLWDGQRWQQQQLPYGTRPRLALIHISSEAIRTQSTTVDVGGSVREFLKRLDITVSGAEHRRFQNQMKALAACRLSLGWSGNETVETLDAKPIERFAAWLHPTGDQETFWRGEVTLTNSYFESLAVHAVPLDHRALSGLSGSALALDVYTWLANRLHRVRGRQMLTWWHLHNQFGQEYQDVKQFKRNFKVALGKALAVYPEAKIEPVKGGIQLTNSPTPIRQRKVYSLSDK